MTKSPFFKKIFIICALSIGYLILGLAGMELAANEVASPVWPAGGFAVGGAILFGYWASLSGLFGSIFLSSAHSPDVLVSIWIGLGAMVQALCGRYIALRLFKLKTFKDYTDVFIHHFLQCIWSSSQCDYLLSCALNIR